MTALYGDMVKADDLDASYAGFFAPAAALVEAGQANGVALASGYLETLISLEAGRQARLTDLSATGVVGINAEGATLAEGMAAMPAMVKEQIGKGVPVAEAMAFGQYLAERFADAEVTSAVDRHTDAVTRASGQFTGWTGVLAGTCDRCRSKNGGTHDLGTPMYRHPHCKCSKQFAVQGGSRTIVTLTSGSRIAVNGGTAKQHEIIASALGRVPKSHLGLAPDINILPTLKSRSGQELFGLVDSRGMNLNGSVLKIGKRYSREELEFDILHEFGHTVMGNDFLQKRTGALVSEMRATFAETKFYSSTSLQNADEAWAEAYALRITTGRSLGKLIDAIFRKLGI